jgi:hypothetical protein
MKVFKQANLVRIVILAAMAVLVCPNAILAKEELVNPSFETGDLSDWDTDIPDVYSSDGGEINVTESHNTDWPNYTLYSAKDGLYFALLKADGYNSYTALQQTFFASAGSTISGWAFFDAQDYAPYNDNAQVRIIDSDGKLVDTVFYASVNIVEFFYGSYGETPWTKWEYTFAEPGTYKLEARVGNGIDANFDSFMGLDGVVLTLKEPEEPKVLKQNIIDQLWMYAHESKQISKAIREIEKSLEDKLWADNFHLKSEGGKKVLDRERHAARELVHLLKGISDDGKCGGISLIELKYTGSLPIDVDVYLKNVLLGSFHVEEEGDTFVVEATEETGGKLHPEIKLVSGGIELAKIHTSCSKPINIDDEHGYFIIVDLDKLPPKSDKKGKKHQISEEAQVAVGIAIEQLVKADRLLAEIQLDDARLLVPADPARQDKFEREIAKAEKELAKGDENRDDYKLGKAIHHYKKVWEHATRAIKEATKLPKS